MATVADSSTRAQLIEMVLSAAIARQQVGEVSALDLTKIAVDIEAALESDFAGHPLDPEGDGLETDELNAANDV